MTTQRIGFGGGCHWCTEAVFAHARGVVRVEQGFISSAPPDETFSEGVIVHYDPAETDASALTHLHLETHSSGSNHSFRNKYRSAVYTLDTAEAETIAKLLGGVRARRPVVTRVLPLRAFRPSEDRYRDYYARNRGKPFCETYIEPKLRIVRSQNAIGQTASRGAPKRSAHSAS